MNELTAAQRVSIARNPHRPNIVDYIEALFPDFFECRGDRLQIFRTIPVDQQQDSIYDPNHHITFDTYYISLTITYFSKDVNNLISFC